ncbi:MAG: nicotinamide riboside transporter PnuC [Tenuifilaceae bacterium]
MPIIEGIATFFGLICVWLTVKQNIWCWPTGIAQVALYIFVFYEAHLYSDMILHIFYVFINIYGWYHWLKKDVETEELKVSRTGKAFIGWVVVCIVGTFAWGFLLANYTDAALPYPDSFITAASLIAQWLMARKVLESWIFWIIVDIVAVFVYLIKSLYLTTGLYAIFLIMATIGYFEWRKAFISQKTLPLLAE